MKSVRLTLYNEVMAHRVPILLVNCNILSHVNDWSSEVCKHYIFYYILRDYTIKSKSKRISFCIHVLHNYTDSNRLGSSFVEHWTRKTIVTRPLRLFLKCNGHADTFRTWMV